MRRRLQALACIGSLAALSSISAPPTAAHAAGGAPETSLEGSQGGSAQACRVHAAEPSIDASGTIRGTASRAGCVQKALLRVRVQQVVAGPERTLKSGSRQLTNGRITATLPCSDTPRRYQVVALDDQGEENTSDSVLLSCEKPSSTRTGATRTATTRTAGASSAETEVVRLTNKARAAGGCRPLTHDAKLRTAADRHSADMAAKRYFDHTAKNGSSAGDRIQAAGFAPVRTWGENIAMGQRTAASVVQGWLNSPGHRANIMNCKFTHIGVGQHSTGPHWTQVFASH
ncbi:CAP domain-containing protein [Nonomuraea sp. NPDC049714]|uniref:CAP domain-containing protein n=1 Tax=Nonomuraea sp. NPDC049714 TaxID=3364357 RepID=UPI0037A21BB7